ncbi:hypothetical protein H9Y05_08225 [Crocinitomicaceae bacterium CZZ-1]|uniref:Prenyltransferase n=1 Tax=Taishania pollutisoli TaxID=2766479 RepID=A0A8J6TSP5_9FLAO|nr:hypothetical protein [Taishania pollutisoli]MBC9812457.1 hypothetical protein [Taishania pollutisoli]
MQFFRRIGYFLVASNLVVSFSGGFLAFGIARHFSLEHPLRYASILFLLIFAVYTLQRIVDQSGFSASEPSVWGNATAIPVVFSLVALLGAFILGISVFHFSPSLVFLSVFFSFLCYWYTVPFFGQKLREIPGIKIVVTAMTWSYGCVVFPLINEGIPLQETLLFSLLFFLYLTAIILPFDIRDVHIDDVHHSTVPQRIDIPLTKLLGTVLLIGFTAGNIGYRFIAVDNWIFHIAVALQLLFLLFTSEKRGYFFFGCIDLLMMLLGWSYLL